jgi:GNAT superfamily N-acetyltransferase
MTSRVEIREGSAADADLLLAWFDEAVRWMVARGQPGQWGSAPFSSRPDGPERVSRLAGGGGLRIAELNREPVAALVVGCAPDYVSPADRPELYIVLVLTSRQHAGKGIGARLVQRAIDEARCADRAILRVDCWAGAPGLMRWYERQGFQRTETFDVNGWAGQVFSMPVS